MTNATTIAADAAVGAAGAYSAIAPIPYVGPILAPAAAAQTYAGIMAFQGAAAAEGGFGDVPSDDLPTFLHAREMVLPAKFASPLRDMLTRPTPFSPAEAAAGISHSTTNNAGDSHFNHSPTYINNGSQLDMEQLAKRTTAHAYDMARNWSGKGSRNLLPGRGK